MAQEWPKNSFKVSLPGIYSKIYAAQYERVLTKNLSLNTTVFYRPETSIPFGQEIDKIAKRHGLGITGVNFENLAIDLSQIGVKGFSPELRYYFGQRKNRTFVAAFGQYEKFDAIIPASLQARYQNQVVELSKVPIDFDIRTISGGLMIGRQWRPAKWLAVDFVLIGPHLGKGQKVYAVVQNPLLSRLDESDKEYLREKIIERFQLNEDYYEVSVADDKAEINAYRKVPYLGIRGFGVNLGVYF